MGARGSRLFAALLIVLLLAVGGCTGGSSGGTDPSSAVTTGPGARSSIPPAPSGQSGRSGVWTLPVARRRYLADVGPTDTMLAQLRATSRGNDLAALQRVCGHLWAGYGRLPSTLRAGRWPAGAGPAVTKFVAAVQANRPGLLNCSTSETHTDAAGQARFAAANVTSAGNAVRAALGLPRLR